MHQRHAPFGKRAIVEVRLPARRPGERERYVALGQMPTPRQNDAVVALPSLIATDCGPLLGEWITRPKRLRRPDKVSGRYIDRYGEIADGLTPEALTQRLAPNERVIREPDETQVRLTRAEVQEALVSGARLRMRWRVVQEHGQLRTIPDKGKVVRWGSVDDLVQALVQGVPF